MSIDNIAFDEREWTSRFVSCVHLWQLSGEDPFAYQAIQSQLRANGFAYSITDDGWAPIEDLKARPPVVGAPSLREMVERGRLGEIGAHVYIPLSDPCKLTAAAKLRQTYVPTPEELGSIAGSLGHPSDAIQPERYPAELENRRAGAMQMALSVAMSASISDVDVILSAARKIDAFLAGQEPASAGETVQ